MIPSNSVIKLKGRVLNSNNVSLSNMRAFFLHCKAIMLVNSLNNYPSLGVIKSNIQQCRKISPWTSCDNYCGHCGFCLSMRFYLIFIIYQGTACILRILLIRCRDCVPTVELRCHYRLTSALAQLIQRRLHWSGHAVRRTENELIRDLLFLTPHGARGLRSAQDGYN